MLDKVRHCLPLLLLFQITVVSVDAAPKAALEIFSYWTSGSEAAALKALLDLYKEQNPGVEIVNATVAGGNGSAALPVLQARLLGGNPPGHMANPSRIRAVQPVCHGRKMRTSYPALCI